MSYTSIITDIAAAFNAATPTLLVETSFGQGLAAPDQEDIVSQQGFRNVLIKVDDTPESDVHNATYGTVKEGRAMMWSVAPTPDEALDTLKTWWLTICASNGNILHNVKTQTTLGTMVFMR